MQTRNSSNLLLLLLLLLLTQLHVGHLKLQARLTKQQQQQLLQSQPLTAVMLVLL
jgi:hypothetical protein